MADRNRNRPRFDQLNWFGKAMYLGGTAVRLSANLIDGAVDRAAKIAADSKRAFERELDPNIEDAHILEEHDDRHEAPHRE